MVLTCLWHVGRHMTASSSDKETAREKKQDVEGVRGDDKKNVTKKTPPLQERSGLIISSIAFKLLPSKQNGHRLPEEVKAENRGERRKPMREKTKQVGYGEVKREVMRKGWRREPNATTHKS